MKHTCACLRFSVRPYGDLPLNPDCEQTAGGPTPGRDIEMLSGIGRFCIWEDSAEEIFQYKQ